MIKFPDCDFCKNCTGSNKDIIFCKAFPDGIPFEHIFKDLKLMKECNNGIGFEHIENNK